MKLRELLQMNDSFIPAELAVAPNPLGLAPNLKLTTIPVDAYTCFELWMPTANAQLMRAEATLLMEDCSRLEEICSKLIWLIGAKLIHPQEPHHQRLIYDWREVRQHLEASGHYFNAIAIRYQPQTICPHPQDNNFSTTWTWQPARWQVHLLHLNSFSKGFAVNVLPISLAIANGDTITKSEKHLHVMSNHIALT